MKPAAVLACAVLAVQPVHAVDSEPDPLSRLQSSRDADYDAGKQAVEAKSWKAALEHFNRSAARDPKNADVQNMLGYAYRKSGNLNQAFKHYHEALRLDPRHRGAHEYIGEAYLQAGNLPKAEEHLAALDKLCFFSCEEYRDLKKAVDEFRKSGK